MPEPTLVDRIAPPSRSAFCALYEERDRPVVIEGGARDFPATRTWTPDSLVERLGSVELAFKVSDDDAHPNLRAADPSRWFAREKSTLAEFFPTITEGTAAARKQRLFTGDERFLLQRRDDRVVRDPELGVLLDDVPVPSIVPEERLYTVWGWFSGPGVRTGLH